MDKWIKIGKTTVSGTLVYIGLYMFEVVPVLGLALAMLGATEFVHSLLKLWQDNPQSDVLMRYTVSVKDKEII